MSVTLNTSQFCTEAHTIESSGRWVVWSGKPAADWEDAFVTGNGRHGTMVMSQPENERVICVHEELFVRAWDRDKVAVADIANLLPEVRRLIKAGRTNEAALLADSTARKQLVDMGAPHVWPLFPHPAFDLRITHSTDADSRISGYRRQLDLETGEVLTRWQDEAGGIEQRVFSSRAANVNVVQLRGTSGRKLNLTLMLEETPGRTGSDPKHAFDAGIDLINAFKVVRSEAVQGWLSYHAEYAADHGGYEGLSRITTKGGGLVPDGACLQVTDAEEVLIVLRITPQADGPRTCRDETQKELTTLPYDYGKLLEPHAREHGGMFRRVTLDLECAAQWVATPTEQMVATAHERGVTPLFLEQMHAMGRYLAISSFGKYPPPLQGIWGGGWRPDWAGGFVLDANLNLAVSSVSMGDLPECAESYFSYVERILPGWRLNARSYLGCRGFLSAHYSDPEKGYLNHFILCVPWMYWPSGAGWSLLPFLEHAELTGDRDFLEKRVLPLYRELAEFYEDYLVLGADDRYHFLPSISPENVPLGTSTLLCKDATMDVAVAREVFDALIRMGRRLKLNGSDIARWQAYREKLLPYRINTDGALAEWIDPRYSDIYEHRHSSHLYPVWPGTELLQPDADPALLRAAQVALDRRSLTDTSSAFGLIHVALIATRLHDVEKVRTNLDRFSRRNYVYAGLMTSHEPDHSVYNLDSVLSLPRLLMEMLVYTEQGRIELMPAWPKDFPDGSITGIRVQNGHSLDIVWSAGKLVYATLHPVRDDTCEIRYGDTAKSVGLKAGEPLQFTP